MARPPFLFLSTQGCNAKTPKAIRAVGNFLAEEETFEREIGTGQTQRNVTSLAQEGHWRISVLRATVMLFEIRKVSLFYNFLSGIAVVAIPKR
jgi:hypothetical protein